MDSSNRPLILVVNDDGIDSPGIFELASQLTVVGEVLVVAPNRPHSGASRPFPASKSYQYLGSSEVREFVFDDTTAVAYAHDGTPNACTLYGIKHLVDRPVDVCVSGVNFGPNIGRGLFSSGTIAAAMEATDLGIPSVAISQMLEANRPGDFEGLREMFRPAAQIATRIVEKVLGSNLGDEEICLNVNVPVGATLETSVVQTNQSPYYGWEWNMPDRQDFAKPSRLTWTRDFDTSLPPGTDMHAVIELGVVSVTPLTSRMQDTFADRNVIGRLLA